MYKNLVLKYINLLSPDHIREFASNNNIYITNEEVLIIYEFIIEHHKSLLESDKDLELLRPKIRKDLYSQIKDLYYEYKAKYL